MTAAQAKFAATNNIEKYIARQWTMIIILTAGTLALTVAPVTAAIATITGMIIAIAK